MTEKQLEIANNIQNKISDIQGKIKKIEDLMNRVIEITKNNPEYTASFKIKVGEPWCYTPEAPVRVDSFQNYLRFEKVALETEVEELRKEFDKL